jgi:hypothetical protein
MLGNGYKCVRKVLAWSLRPQRVKSYREMVQRQPELTRRTALTEWLAPWIPVIGNPDPGWITGLRQEEGQVAGGMQQE